MPRGGVLLAALLLLMLIGVAVVAGLFRPNESDPTRALALFTGGDPERGKQTIRRPASYRKGSRNAAQCLCTPGW
jgi:hypothetical protein